MTNDELQQILRRHATWLDKGYAKKWDDPDRARLDGARLDGARLVGASLDGASLVRASLDRARLDGARLVGARLVGASLDGARLDGARLVGASLVGASLVGASLVRASLVGASLWNATGIICLPIGDSRGYRPVAVWQGDLWRIASGCRWLTVDDARAHWGADGASEGCREIADQYLAALDWLEKQPTPETAVKQAAE